MGLPVVYRQAASREIIAAARAYEGYRKGLGASFVNEVVRLEAHLSDAPGLYQMVLGEVRRAILRRFPYGLFYLEELERVVVLACLDLRRDPAAIRERIARR